MKLFQDNDEEKVEEVGERYPEEEIVYRALRGKQRKRFVLTHLAKETGSLLDLGCNAGVYLSELKGRKAVGIDISLSVLKRQGSDAPATKVPHNIFLW